MPNKMIKGFKCASIQLFDRSRGRIGKRKLWTNENMEAAILSVAKRDMSANKAADLRDIPRSTLKYYCLSGRVVHGTIRDQSLTPSSIGLGRTRHDVKSIVGSFVKRKGMLKGKTVSNG